MKKAGSAAVAVFLIIGIFCVLVLGVVFYPGLLKFFSVPGYEETDPAAVDAKTASTFVPAEEELFLVIMQGQSGIEALTLAVMNTNTGGLYYVDVPVATKVSLPSALYNELQVYAPELPQYLTLSNVCGYFSDEYKYTGLKRIVSEAVGKDISHYVAGAPAFVTLFTRAVETREDVAESVFFEKFAIFAERFVSDLTPVERETFYESFRNLKVLGTEEISGEWKVGDYLVARTHAKTQIEELFRYAFLGGAQ